MIADLAVARLALGRMGLIVAPVIKTETVRAALGGIVIGGHPGFTDAIYPPVKIAHAQNPHQFAVKLVPMESAVQRIGRLPYAPVRENIAVPRIRSAPLIRGILELILGEHVERMKIGRA